VRIDAEQLDALVGYDEPVGTLHDRFLEPRAQPSEQAWRKLLVVGKCPRVPEVGNPRQSGQAADDQPDEVRGHGRGGAVDDRRPEAANRAQRRPDGAGHPAAVGVRPTEERECTGKPEAVQRVRGERAQPGNR
jgi:hypothetical protein